MINPPKFEVLKDTSLTGFHILEIQDGPFQGITFHYSEVTFEEKDDDAILHFNYTVLVGEVTEDAKESFGKMIGDILLSILEEQLAKNEVVYANGSDTQPQL
jgi:hypothetical protein